MDQRKRPFPYYLLLVLALLILLLVLLLRYASTNLFSKDPPRITVTAAGQSLPWVVEKNQWNGSAYDRETTFVCYDRAGLTPSQLPGGAEVSITMDGTLPDQVSLREYALDSDQRSSFGQSRLLEEHLFFFDGRTGTFSLPAAGDAPIRGFLLTCSWGGNTCEYAVVVQLLP